MSKGPFGKIDPNVQAQREFVLRQFAAQVANGQASAIDRINQKIEVGSLVVYRPPCDLIFEVLDIAPVLNPNEPPGKIKLVLSTILPDLVVMANVRQLNMIVIGKQISEGHADISGPKMTPEPLEDALLAPGELDPRD